MLGYRHPRRHVNEESMKRNGFSRLDLVLLGGILLWAAWLRFTHLDHAELLWDQAEISKWALNMAQRREITWIGPWSSTRLDTFPGAIWLLAIPYALSTSPVFVTGFVALINLGAVAACYPIVRCWFGRTAAWIATLLFAVAPWAVIYSRKIWHTELLAPFVPFYVVTGWYAFVRGRRWAVLAHSLALAGLIQIHFAALVFVPLTVLWGLIFSKRLCWRMVPLGVLLAALTFLPYFIHDAQAEWRNVRLFAQIMQQPAVISSDALRGTWIMTTGQNLSLLTGPDRYPDFVAATLNLRWLFPLIGGAAVVAALLAVGRALRQARTGLDDETAAILMVTTWWITPALFLTCYLTRIVAPHYFTTILPAPFILAGWLIWRLISWAKQAPGQVARVAQGVLVALVVGLVGAQTYETISVLRFVITHDTPWGYGTPMAYEIQAVQTATRLCREMGDGEVILLSEGDDPRIFEMPAAADVLMYESDVPHRAVDIRTALVLPSGPAVYWATYPMAPGEDLLAAFAPEVVEARIPLREGVRSFRFYRWPGGAADVPFMPPPPGGVRRWANGVELLGYALEGDVAAGEQVRWTLVWRVTRISTADGHYHWFNHLVDEQGRMRAQKDGPSFLPTYWRVGDVVFNWFELEIPPDAPAGDYRMRVGMYTYPALEGVPLLAEDGTSPWEWVEIQLPSRE